MPEPRAWRVAVLVSGGGSNLEALLEAREKGSLPGVQFVLVLSNRKDAFALERAHRRGVPTRVVERPGFSDEAAFQAALLDALRDARPDILCLAGFMKKISDEIVDRWRGRILNIHPALLPRFGGPGMYGHHVHEAVLKAGEKESGCTVHLVDEQFDHGPAVLQARVPVLPGDNAATLAARVLEQEHQIYPKALAMLCERLSAAPGVQHD